MVIDTSAIIAILFGELEQTLFSTAIERAPLRLVSAVTRVELSCVVEGRKGLPGRAIVERFFTLTKAETVAVTIEQAEAAIGAFRQFGKGRHPAGLNLGDCFSYALAKTAGQPLLFKGDDFSRTDLRAAVQ
jgi:ribonuclease VapC